MGGLPEEQGVISCPFICGTCCINNGLMHKHYFSFKQAVAFNVVFAVTMFILFFMTW